MVPSSIMHYYCWHCMPPILKSILHRVKTCQEKNVSGAPKGALEENIWRKLGKKAKYCGGEN